MELIDIYDQNGVPTGAVRDKETPLAPNEYRMAVGMWIVDADGKVGEPSRSCTGRRVPCSRSDTGAV